MRGSVSNFLNKSLDPVKQCINIFGSWFLYEFKSQLKRFYFKDSVIRDFHSDFQCSKKNISHVEKYKVLDLFN